MLQARTRSSSGVLSDRIALCDSPHLEQAGAVSHLKIVASECAAADVNHVARCGLVPASEDIVSGQLLPDLSVLQRDGEDAVAVERIRRHPGGDMIAL